MTSSTSYTDADIQDYIDYTENVIAETYPKIKKAVSPHAATGMKKDMLQIRERTLDRIDKTRNPNQQQDEALNYLDCGELMSLEYNKDFFKEMARLHCDAAIDAQIRFSNKAFRATLTKEVILEKCRICDLDEPLVKQILKQTGFDENDAKIARR